MRERQLAKPRPSATGLPQELIIGVGMWPGRKRPVLYVGNEFCASSVLSFPSEAAAELFMEFLVDFTGASEKAIETTEAAR